MLYSYPADYDPATIASAANTVISQFFKNYTDSWTKPELFEQIYGLKMDPNFTTPIQRIQTIAQFYFILISKKFDCLSRVRDRRLRKFNVMITSIFRDDRLSGEFCHPLHHWKYNKFTSVQNYIKINSEKLKRFTLPQSRAPCVFLLIPLLSLSMKFVRPRSNRRNVVVLRLFVSMSS